MTRLHDSTPESLVRSSDTRANTDGLIANVLDNVRLRGAVFFEWQPRWPYATGVPDGRHFRHLILPSSEQVISYHVVLQGPCWATVADEPAKQLHSGDILLLPHGDAYTIADRPRPPSERDIEPAKQFFSMMAAGELPLTIHDGGNGPQHNRLVCGFLGCDRHPCNPILNQLPKAIVLPRATLDSDLNALIDMVLKQCGAHDSGSRLRMVRLGELLFIEVLRCYVKLNDQTGNAWLQGLSDPLVARTLALLHDRTAEPWTLDQLAHELGSSRSTVSDRFQRLIGLPPMQYLSRWRMQVAARLLRDGQAKILAVAADVGYDSEAAFSRAFKRIVGVSPSDFRKAL